MLFVNKKCFVSSFPICMSFISFPASLHLAGPLVQRGRHLIGAIRVLFLISDRKFSLFYVDIIIAIIEIVLGHLVAQSVEHPTSAPVMISRFMGSSPTLGSVLTAQSLEPASDSVSPSLSAPPLLMLCLFLSQK